MLKTALKPRWIMTLILVMALAAVFVLLSQWQFSTSRQAEPTEPSTTETVKPLTDVLTAGSPLTASVADQMVSATGSFVPGTRLLVHDRLQDGREGLWLISAFAVDGAAPGTDAGAEEAGAVIPVVHGWVPDAAAAESVPEITGPAAVTGRLLPPEGPVAADPVAGQVATLATAELVNVWDLPAYAAFVVSASITVDGAGLEARAPLEPVEVAPQPQERPINWLNIFYAIEWFVFAGFAFFLWWRLVADDHRRGLEDAEHDAAERDAAELKPAEQKPAEQKPAEQKPAEQKPAEQAEQDPRTLPGPDAAAPTSTEAGTRE